MMGWDAVEVTHDWEKCVPIYETRGREMELMLVCRHAWHSFHLADACHIRILRTQGQPVPEANGG